MITLKGTVLLLTTTVGAALAASPAVADTRFEMTSYSNAPGGKEIAAADYAGAIDVATRSVARFSEPGPLVAATNLCVAYTLTQAFDKAADACAEALTIARSTDRSTGGRLAEHTATSVALRNRGVLRAVSGDAAGAAVDFRKAALRGDTLAAATRNLEHLTTSPTYRMAVAVTSN